MLKATFGASLLALGLMAGPGASAQTYPSRTITLVVPFGPGGLSDVPGRFFAAELQQRTGQSVVDQSGQQNAENDGQRLFETRSE